MSEPTPLEHARAVKLRLRAASKNAAEARKDWTGLRLLMAKAQHENTRAMHAEAIGIHTLRMWGAEQALAAIAEEWRACLAARAAMPKAERWNLAGVERWAEIAAVMERQP